MAISRMQQPRQQYGLGSIVKSVKKAVSGVAKGAKGLLKSPMGKAALYVWWILQGSKFGNLVLEAITFFK